MRVRLFEVCIGSVYHDWRGMDAAFGETYGICNILMEAIGIILAQSPSVRFILAGGHRNCTGAEMEAWLLHPSLVPHRTQIKFTGWLTPNQMAQCYQRANILV